MAKWRTVAPINPEYYKETTLTLPFALGGNVYFEKAPGWLSRIVGIEKLSEPQRENIIKKAVYIFCSEYDAESFGDPYPGEERSKQAVFLERIQLSNLALWIVKPSKLGFNLFFHIREENGDFLLINSAGTAFLEPHDKDSENSLDANDFESAKNINSKIQNLNRNGSIWIAIYTLWLALLNDKTWELRFLLLWVALEALFGTKTEITFRISQRISFFVFEKEERLKSYNMIKENYGWRSKIVHGMKLNSLEFEESAVVLYNTETIIRKVLIKILNDENLIKVFSDDKTRDEYLDELVFNVGN